MIITSSRVCQVYALCKVPATPYSNASRTHTDGHVHTLRQRQTCSGTTPRHTHVAIKLQMPSAHCPCCCFVAAVEERVENISLKCVPPLECSSPPLLLNLCPTCFSLYLQHFLPSLSPHFVASFVLLEPKCFPCPALRVCQIIFMCVFLLPSFRMLKQLVL